MDSTITAGFLHDLDIVCPRRVEGNLQSGFLEDLDAAYIHARALPLEKPPISLADLQRLSDDLEAWRSYHQRILHRYLDVLSRDDPLRLPVSLFGTMDYGRLETGHTRTLAWLLGDKEHGFGFQLLEALLHRLTEGRRIRLSVVHNVQSEYLVYSGALPTDQGRIDILAEGRWQEFDEERSWRLVIEAKIDAEEGEDQLRLYDEWLQLCPESTEVLRVFLTTEGRRSVTGCAEWQPFRFVDLASVFRRVSSGLQDRPGYHFLRYYLASVLRDICRLPVPISSDCDNPYAANDYLQSVLNASETGDDNERSW